MNLAGFGFPVQGLCCQKVLNYFQKCVTLNYISKFVVSFFKVYIHKFMYLCCSAKHTSFRRKVKDWLAGNQDNVSELGDMWASIIQLI